MVFTVAVVAAAITAGCASAPPLRTEASTSGIHAAGAVGAANAPQATLDSMVDDELAVALSP
jgi:hypothetical protein